ncbi:MAG TPA: magnesium/cobalt transporter CorA [Solirubrobacteraceae bacterium]|nr:magnesium/cobalt transporter CorA [Solirubrobacteraceae bacterium]
MESDSPPAPAPGGAGVAPQPVVGKTVPCLQSADHDDLDKHVAAGRFFWLDLEDPNDEQLQLLGSKLGLHPLTVDDARSFHERPKIEEFETYVYMVLYGVDPGATSGTPLLREVHMAISGAYVVTIHHGAINALTELRERTAKTPVRTEQFMIYKVLDAVVSTYFPVLQKMDDDIDAIEEAIIASPDEASLKQIFSMKRDLVDIRRVVTPLRDVFARDAERIADLPGMEADDRAYFRDVYDSLIRISDLVDSYRDLLSGATDMYLSTVANRQGEVGKQLAIIATIFLPLSFLTGFWGQNFSFLTGHIIDNNWTFFVLGIGLLVASVGALWIFFRRKRWI